MSYSVIFTDLKIVLRSVVLLRKNNAPEYLDDFFTELKMSLSQKTIF